MAPQAPYPPQGGYDPRFDQRGHHGHGYGHGHHKRRKSWLEEIFD
jgi:Zn-finger nucleic acid-binding protein